MSHSTGTTHPTGSAGPPRTAGTVRTAGAGHRDAPATADHGRVPVTAESAQARIVQQCFGLRPPRLVGAELEWFTRATAGSRPTAALLAEALGAHAPRSIAPGSPHAPLPAGGSVTVEPGGQVEISSLPLTDVDRLCAALAADAAVLRALLDTLGIEMLPGAVDRVREPSRILTVARYAAMQDRFDRSGPRGVQMMCNTAAIHVSVDCGADLDDLALRWRMLDAVGPALVAAFADAGSAATGMDANDGSEGRGRWASERMRTWLTLDPGRTGLDAAAPGASADPVASYTRWALGAPLLCVRRGNGDWSVPGDVTFAQWIAGGAGAPDRAPTIADLDYHLTTLFPPVRPCGHLEVRYLDAQPAGFRGGQGGEPWRAPIAVIAALAGTPDAARRAAAIAEPTRGEWRRAARHGLADEELRGTARALLELAAEAASGGRAAETAEAIESVCRRIAGPDRRPARTGDAPAAEPGDALRAACRGALERARRRTRGLTDIPDDQLTAQHSALMSPLVWDLAHIGNQEDRWLVRAAGGCAATPARAGLGDPSGLDAVSGLDDLYDALQHPRSTRPSLPILGPTEARAYAESVRERAFDVLDHCGFDGDALTADGFVFGMVAQHEQQHDETMLATHQLRTGPALLHAPAAPRARRATGPVSADPAPESAVPESAVPESAVPESAVPESAVPEIVVPGGAFTMGTDGTAGTESWALDNERPAHRVEVAAFAIEALPVTNRRYAHFIADGGYRRRELWSERGWRHRVEEGLEAPQFWSRDGDGRWQRRRFGATVALEPDEPVVHVSYFEAEAFAAWADKRLPTEAEWEKAARHDAAAGRSRTYPWGDAEPTEYHANLGQRHLSPAGAGAYPAGATVTGIHQLIGDVWEWTSSGFEAYPGFRAFPYREYSEVFFGGDYRVLRGGSFGTDAVACRGTFRNWDHPVRRQIFAGIRLARDYPANDGVGIAAASERDGARA